MHRGRFGRWRGLCGGRQSDQSRCQTPALDPWRRMEQADRSGSEPCGEGVSRHAERRGVRGGNGDAAEVCLASDPAAQWTGALKGPAFFAYADNYLIDLQCGVIMDVKASRAIRQAEVGAARTMIERTEERFGLKPQRLAADSAYGAAPMLNWLVEEKQIAPHVAVLDRSKREDGTFPRQNFRYDESTDTYTCPEGKTLTTTG